MDEALSARQKLFLSFHSDRVLAHKIIFAHRHSNEPPPFHREMILDWHSPEQYVCDLAFRGSAKSTIAEEAITLLALFNDFRYCVIFGANATLAEQRLHAIRREFERNRVIHQVFGDVRGQPWGDDRLELTTGVVIRAMGRGQALRGTKEEVERPDLVFLDDVEDETSVATPKGRDKVQKWVMGEVLPAMADPKIRKVRVAANALDPECLAMKLKASGSGFRVRVIPWVTFDAEGRARSAWADRYPMSHINEVRGRMYAMGQGQTYEAEYMCDPTSPETRAFKSEMMKVEPTVRTWQAVYSFTDPARTARATSADTGHAVWSWIGPRLVVWDAWGRKLMPDQIIQALFETNAVYRPVHVGIEEDGLNEFLLQPIRQEQVRRGEALPLKSMKAPRGKLDFIRGLQPYFKAGEVVFAKELTDLKTQLIGFPTGNIDVPNALAYALKMRPGAPVYDDFRGARHVAEGITPTTSRPAWLCLNASRSLVTGVLTQILDGAVRVYGDFVREGSPAEVVGDIVAEAGLLAGQRIRALVGPQHFDRNHNVGLAQAISRVPLEVRPGVAPERGRPIIADLLKRDLRGSPALVVSSEAPWSLNGFSSGFCRGLDKQGRLSDFPEDGVYRTLMEGLESFAGLLRGGSTDDEEGDRLNAITRDGRRYHSMLGSR